MIKQELDQGKRKMVLGEKKRDVPIVICCQTGMQK